MIPFLILFLSLSFNPVKFPAHPKIKFYLQKKHKKNIPNNIKIQKLLELYPEVLTKKKLYEWGLKLTCSKKIKIANILIQKGYIQKAKLILDNCNAPKTKAIIFLNEKNLLATLVTVPKKSKLFRKIIYHSVPSIFVAFAHLWGFGSTTSTKKAALKTFLLSGAYLLSSVIAHELPSEWSKLMEGYALFMAGKRHKAKNLLSKIKFKNRRLEVARQYWFSKFTGTQFIRTTNGPIGWWYSLISTKEPSKYKCKEKKFDVTIENHKKKSLWKCKYMDYQPSKCQHFAPKKQKNLPYPYNGCPILPWFNYYKKASKKFRVPLGLLYAVSWTESRFNLLVISKSDAFGLFQLIPSVAHGMAKELGIKNFCMTQLIDPKISIQIGAYHLKKLYNSLKSWIKVIAAYNAGVNDAKRWFIPLSWKKIDNTVEEISFDETRLYVKYVMATWWYYATSYSWENDIATIKDLIGQKGLGRHGHP